MAIVNGYTINDYNIVRSLYFSYGYKWSMKSEHSQLGARSTFYDGCQLIADCSPPASSSGPPGVGWSSGDLFDSSPAFNVRCHVGIPSSLIFA